MPRHEHYGLTRTIDLTRPAREVAAELGVHPSNIYRRRQAAANRRPTLAELDLTRPAAELVGLTGLSRATVDRAKRRAGLTRPRLPRAPSAPRTPKPSPKPAATPIAPHGRTSPQEPAVAVAPPEPIAANDLDAKIRQAVTDEVLVMGVSPFVASVVVSARYRVAREVVEAIAEDVAGMRRGVARG